MRSKMKKAIITDKAHVLLYLQPRQHAVQIPSCIINTIYIYITYEYICFLSRQVQNWKDTASIVHTSYEYCIWSCCVFSVYSSHLLRRLNIVLTKHL